MLRADFLFGVFFSAGERWLIFDGLHGVMSQKVELFITTAVRTSDPTIYHPDLRMIALTLNELSSAECERHSDSSDVWDIEALLMCDASGISFMFWVGLAQISY
jgi:hypothetical protein